MFDLRQLRYFVAVAEELSFTRAALRLHLSQPPLSQQIRALEEDLDVRLLERNKRHVALTEPGRVFLEQARQILAKADEARSQVTAAAAGYSGQLRLAYSVSVSFHPALPQTLLRYGQIAPKVALQLSEMYTEPQFAALLAGQIDVGFVRDEPTNPQTARSLRLNVIDREPLLLALPTGHPLAGRSSLHLAEVAGDAFVSQPRQLVATLYDRLVKLATRAGFQPTIIQHAQQVNGLLALVAGGLGLALVPASMRAVRLAGVSYVPLEDADAYLLLALASRVDDTSPVLQQFLATVTEMVIAPGL
ncbi:LysR family transcriptional regulator [Rhodanobacter sp. Root179]|uniref:LysR substrate-binding domain-containing protein n=1 Tax=unclassified Rhodanobacter TaxID=2621553 RepID=UPI0006F6EB38|nr:MULTISPECIES: LysR substrate-binding domain-containing protein [unclassified Rhodanobacter]KRB34835.1 LysR family transcriptional regulator [Rhodanobacter sp. Root179]QRP65439.1 LysR family transcriptional regulator [Rhodanobacter sp. FDAARGOS 1247]